MQLKVVRGQRERQTPAGAGAEAGTTGPTGGVAVAAAGAELEDDVPAAAAAEPHAPKKTGVP